MLHFDAFPQHVDQLIDASLTAVHPTTAVPEQLQRHGRHLRLGSLSFDLDHGRLFMVAAGKAAVAMSTAATAIIGDDLAAGVIITKNEARPDYLPSTCRLFYAGHPLPDENSVQAATAVMALAQQATAADLVLCLISGGASALFSQPVVPLTTWQALTDALLASGCTINELNQVRRRLDRVKGGGLARAAAPAYCASLILSDVVGNPLEMIGSGPTVMAETTAGATLAILDRYQIARHLPPDDWQIIHQHLQQPEAPAAFRPDRVTNQVIGDVRRAASAAVAQAAQIGFRAQLLTAFLEGEAREAGRMAAALAREAAYQGGNHCLVLGGETTVTLTRRQGQLGWGGRNQELALAAAVALDGCANVAVAAFASDGEDGPTNAAGALISGATAAQARAQGLDPVGYLDRHDSFTFLQQVGTLLQTGPTGVNVNDLLFILTYEENNN
jgi:glycerate 2-kinase